MQPNGKRMVNTITSRQSKQQTTNAVPGGNLQRLPNDIKNKIAQSLTLKNTNSLSRTSKNSRARLEERLEKFRARKERLEIFRNRIEKKIRKIEYKNPLHANVLGAGVYSVKNPISGKKMAVKKVKGFATNKKSYDEFGREVAAYTNNALIKSGFIPKIYNIWDNGDNGYIVMQLLRPCSISAKEKNTLIYELAKLGWDKGGYINDNFMCNRRGKKFIIGFGKAERMNNNAKLAVVDLHREYT